MKHLTIGVAERGKNFVLPLDLVTQSVAILAKRGVGKSYTAAVFTEELLSSDQQVVVIDPTGAAWGIKSSADGNSPGFKVVIFGGDHADLPLEETAGKVLATAVVEHGFSCVLDLSLFRKAAAVRFLADFLETLYLLNRRPLHLICDEADYYAPQRTFSEDARVVGAMNDIVRRGRKRGLGCTLISQRPSVLNKDVLTQCEMLVAMRLVHPRDIDAVMEWVNVHADQKTAAKMLASLPSLPVGEAWFWSPGWGDIFQLVAIRRRSTFDSGATPKAGEIIRDPKQLASIDLSKLGKEIAETVERAKANDPRELKAELTRLRTKVAAMEKHPLIEVKPPLEVPVITDGQMNELVHIASDLENTVAKAVVVQGWFKSAIQELKAGKLKTPIVRPADFERAPNPRRIPASIPARSVASAAAPASSAVGNGGVRRMLIAIAQRAGINQRQIGIRAGLSSKSGSFSTYVGRLRSNGWVSENGDGFSITEAGLAALGDYEPLPEGPELLQHWLNQFGNNGAGRLLRVIAEAYPNSMTQTEAGVKANISSTSGSFSTYLGRLRALELVEGRGDLRASDELF